MLHLQLNLANPIQVRIWRHHQLPPPLKSNVTGIHADPDATTAAVGLFETKRALLVLIRDGRPYAVLLLLFESFIDSIRYVFNF